MIAMKEMRDLRQYEDSSQRNMLAGEIKKRLAPPDGSTWKKNVLMIIKGLFFAMTLMAFEYAIRNPEVEGILRTIFRIGFVSSIAGVLLIPYGAYGFIKNFSSVKNRD
jgi:hypothetical protein